MKIKIITLALLGISWWVQPAAADLWIEWPNGNATYIANDAIFWGMIICVAFLVLFGLLNSSSEGSGTSDSSLNAADQAQQYDDEAVQYRAMSRKLDAETDLAESLIKAKRTRAELDDVEEFLRDDKGRRRR